MALEANCQCSQWRALLESKRSPQSQLQEGRTREQTSEGECVLLRCISAGRLPPSSRGECLLDAAPFSLIMMLQTLIGVALVPAALLWGPVASDAAAAGLQTLGWYHLPPISRLVLAVSVPFLLLVLLTVTCPRFRAPRGPHTLRISPGNYERQRDTYTQEALTRLYNSQEFADFRREVESGRIVSAFEGSDGSFSGDE